MTLLQSLQGPVEESVMITFWKIPVPSKMCVFDWSLLLVRLPTQDALVSRGVELGTHERFFPFWFEHEETIPHLFLQCDYTVQLWRGIERWLGCSSCPSSDWMVQEKCAKHVICLIWLASLWSIWPKRNNTLFEGSVESVSKSLNKIKNRLWGWFISKVGRLSSFTILDWWHSPVSCAKKV